MVLESERGLNQVMVYDAEISSCQKGSVSIQSPSWQCCTKCPARRDDKQKQKQEQNSSKSEIRHTYHPPKKIPPIILPIYQTLISIPFFFFTLHRPFQK